MRYTMPALALSLALILAGGAQAQPTALLFATPHLAEVEAGSTLNYTVDAIRTDGETGDVSTAGGDIRLVASAVDDPDRRTIAAKLVRNGRSRELDAFRGVAGNPILVIFLEQITQDLARATGGSKSYLRNRLRDGMEKGLIEETAGATTRLTMRPLDQDPNAAALGPYTTLEIAFELDSDLPGMFRELSAKAGPEEAPVFLEEVIYAPTN